MHYSIFLTTFACLLILSTSQHEPPRRKAKKHNQEIRQRSDGVPDPVDVRKLVEPFLNLDKFTIGLNDPPPAAKEQPAAAAVEPECQPCVAQSKVKAAIHSFWNDDLRQAHACTCHLLLNKKDPASSGMAQALAYSLSAAKSSVLAGYYTKRVEAPPSDAPATSSWEVLGPLGAGKLEVDADPAFSAADRRASLDHAKFILAMASTATVSSDLMRDGRAGWRTVAVKSSGEVRTCGAPHSHTDIVVHSPQVDLHFSVSWNELAQGVSSTAVFEFQGWARATTYVRATGSYIVTCSGETQSADHQLSLSPAE